MAHKKKKKTIDWLLKNYLPFLKEFGMSKENILNHYNEWKFNRTDKIEDYLWYLFNFLLNENARQSTDSMGFYRRNNDIYIQMLNFRRKIENKTANEIQQAININRLQLQIETKKYEFNVIVITTNDCEACKNIHEKIYTVSEALEDKIIPYNKCTRKQGCACLYSIKLKTDKNDIPIKK